jgi:hypothetical protein
VTVKDSSGNFVGNLKLEDFKITERAYGRNGELLGEKPASFEDHASYKFEGKGFWEKSINSDKLDIAFFIDETGSMGKRIDSIKEQLRNFVNRLTETGTDFRIFISMYETENEPEWTVSNYVSRFFGPTMLEEIKEAIEEIETNGEWWNLTWGYDAYLWSLNLDWREDARKIVVIITDVYTDSVYGPNWYFSSGCVTSMHAVDMAIRDTKIQLYYCQPEEEDMAKIELSENYSPQVNIAIKENNFDQLAKRNPLVRETVLAVQPGRNRTETASHHRLEVLLRLGERLERVQFRQQNRGGDIPRSNGRICELRLLPSREARRHENGCLGAKRQIRCERRCKPFFAQ